MHKKQIKQAQETIRSGKQERVDKIFEVLVVTKSVVSRSDYDADMNASTLS